ncbi:hypothetical protein CEXT_348351 [Caerostris extrusa]|uniref:Uncharacterized protein n=1 Tax=Caerostris extrusa TaxID=172846 RepID=A0AAV4MQW3_CAEEX|nr:hypothetical protein CEXT_348351 [Caerostris extrusa]
MLPENKFKATRFPVKSTSLTSTVLLQVSQLYKAGFELAACKNCNDGCNGREAPLSHSSKQRVLFQGARRVLLAAHRLEDSKPPIRNHVTNLRDESRKRKRRGGTQRCRTPGKSGEKNSG